MRIETLNPAAAEVRDLIALVDAYYARLYPPASNHLESTAALSRNDALFLGCRIDGQLVACGAGKAMRDEQCYAEIKRLFVRDQYRGRGLSLLLMEQLEREFEQQGIRLLRLETGVKQTAALGLYRKLGYRERGPFGNYDPDPLSVFMEKRLVGDR